MITDEEKSKILELAEECPSRIFAKVQQYFNAENLHDDLVTYLVDGLGYYCKEDIVIEAIKRNLLPVVKLYYLITRVNINSIVEIDEMSYLNYAMSRNKKSIVEYLVNLGPEVVANHNYGLTPLQTALAWATTEIAQFLLFHKYNVVLSNAMEIIKFLIDKPTDFYTKDGCSMLLCYASKISKDALELVLSVSPVYDIFVQWPDCFSYRYEYDLLTYIINEKKSKALLKVVVEKVGNLDSFTGHYKMDVLSMVAKRNPKMIPVLMGKATLRRVIRNKHHTFRFRPDSLRMLYFINKAYVIHILEKCGVDVYDKMPSDHNELYHWCVYEAGIEVFLYEIEKGANINHLNKNKQTPLKYALEELYDPYKEVEHLVSIIAKMIENKEFVNEENYLCLERDEDIKEHYENCREELSHLRNEKLTETLSYFDFLTGNQAKLTELARRKVMVTVPKEDEGQFPIYYEHLKRNVQRSNWRMQEMGRIYKITEYWLPPMITDIICGYLRDKDLRRSKHYFTALAELVFKSKFQKPPVRL